MSSKRRQKPEVDRVSGESLGSSSSYALIIRDILYGANPAGEDQALKLGRAHEKHRAP